MRNSRAPRDTRIISRSGSTSPRRFLGVHSSSASMHINSRGRDVMAFFSISTMSGSRGPRSPNSFLASWKAFRVCSGVLPLLVSCLKIAPSILVVDCSRWARKSQYNPTAATSFPSAWSHKLSITRGLLFADCQQHVHVHYLALGSFLPDISFPHPWIPVTEQHWLCTTIFRITPFSN